MKNEGRRIVIREITPKPSGDEIIIREVGPASLQRNPDIQIREVPYEYAGKLDLTDAREKQKNLGMLLFAGEGKPPSWEIEIDLAGQKFRRNNFDRRTHEKNTGEWQSCKTEAIEWLSTTDQKNIEDLQRLCLEGVVQEMGSNQFVEALVAGRTLNECLMKGVEEEKRRASL